MGWRTDSERSPPPTNDDTQQNITNFSEFNKDETVPKILYCPTAPLFGDISPRLKIRIQDKEVFCLLDSGAEITVAPKSLLDKLQMPSISCTATRTVQAFGGASLTLEGPRCLSIEICEVKIVHPIYFLDANTPIIVGYDLMKAAKLVMIQLMLVYGLILIALLDVLWS